MKTLADFADGAIYSDLYKDVYGVRPRGLEFADEAAFTESFKNLIEDANIEFRREREAQDRRVAQWNKYLQEMQDNYGIDRKTAIRWDMDSHKAGQDAGYYCYLVGIPYSYDAEVTAAVRG